MNTGGRKMDRKTLMTAALAMLLAALIAVAIWNYLNPGGGAGGGGGGGTTTTTGPGGGTTTLYPGNIPNAYDLILVEDHVNVVDGRYTVTATAIGTYRSVVAYGGGSVSGNITSGVAAIRWTSYVIPLVAFASRNATLSIDFPGMKIRLNDGGGYVFYEPVNVAIYYQRLVFNISSAQVYVWVPSKTLPTTLVPGAYHIHIDPQYGTYYVSGTPYPLERISPPEKRAGVLRGWLVTATTSGTYTFTINP